MNGAPPTEYTCEAQNFERIVVARRGGLSPYRTDLIACAECRVMHYCPEAAPAPPPAKWTPAASVIDPHKVRPK